MQKHTEGGDFRQATYRAVRQGLRCAKSILLEPVYDFTLEVPNENVGRAMSDIQRMSGTFNSPEAKGENSVLTGTAPVSEMGNYTKKKLCSTLTAEADFRAVLKAMSRVTTVMKLLHKSATIVMPMLTIRAVLCFVLTEQATMCRGMRSVSICICRVFSMLRKTMKSAQTAKTLFAKCKTQDDIFALDKELMQIFEQTYGPVTRRKHAPEKRHVKAVSSIDKAAEKYKKSPVYDGTEYLLVDGYNVIFAWEHLKELSERSLDGARHALINILCNYQGYSKCNLILVFDAYKVKGEHREVETVNNISIVYTKEAETADMFIEKTSHKLAKTNKVRVVTSDALEQMIILGNGALRVSSRAFLEEVRQAENEIREIINSSNELNNNMN